MKQPKPCPFCGGDAYIDVLMGTMHVRAHHKRSCKMRPDTWLLSSYPIEKQIKYWNRRHKKEGL